MTESYPEHAKLEAVQDKAQIIGEFLDDTGYRICELVCVRCGETTNRTVETCCSAPDEHYLPLRKPIEHILAEYFGISLKRLEKEKAQMLAGMRERSQGEVNDSSS